MFDTTSPIREMWVSLSNKFNDYILYLREGLVMEQFLLPTLGVIILLLVMFLIWVFSIKQIDFFNSEWIDEVVSFICVIFIIGWAACVTVFVFPFYCYKNREKLKDIHSVKVKKKS